MIKTDIVKVYEDFCNFTTKEMKKSLYGALRSCGRELVRLTRRTLRSVLKNTNKINPKYNDTLSSGVRMGKVKEDKDGPYLHVLITSKKTPGSGSFRLHILEKGSFKSGVRFVKTYKGKPLKKPRSAGILKPFNFFSTSTDSFHNEYDTKMNSALGKSVEKINNKKFGK